MSEASCVVPACTRDRVAYSMCHSHYQRCLRKWLKGDIQPNVDLRASGRVPWEDWLTKPFGKPRGHSANGKVPPAPRAPQVRDRRAVVPPKPRPDLEEALKKSEAKLSMSSGGGISFRAPPVDVAEPRPVPRPPVDPVLAARVKNLRDAADYLSGIVDTTAVRKAVQRLLQAPKGSNLPIPLVEALDELERAARGTPGWAA